MLDSINHHESLFQTMRVGAIAAAVAVVAASSGALAQAAAPSQPSGTVSVHIGQVGYIGSVSKGEGVLHYQGRDYRFTTAGAGLGGLGASTLDASGPVYNLKSPADFGGAYAQLRSGLALGEHGKGRMWLKNSNGVVMSLAGRRKGFALSTGVDALVVTLAR